MSGITAADERMQRFAEAARNFARLPPKRFAALLPHREGIAELRQKGASFGMIREILAMAGIEVAADTVRRFYREAIEEPRAGAKCSRKRERQAAPHPLQPPAPAASPPLSGSAPPPPAAAEQPRSRGPRIADPRNL